MSSRLDIVSRLRGTMSRLWVLRRCHRVGSGVTVVGTVTVLGTGTIDIGDGVYIDGLLAPVELHADAGATLVIGNGVRLSSGVSIESMGRVEIGARTSLSCFCKVLDSNFHPVSGDRHASRPQPTPVTIGADCEMGWRTIVLPGAQIGDGVRVLGNCVVSRRIPPGTTVGGSPLTKIPYARRAAGA